MAASANASTHSNARWLGLETTCIIARRVSLFLNVHQFGTLQKRGGLGSVASADLPELHLLDGRHQAASDADLWG
jgi:hypothetical protein